MSCNAEMILGFRSYGGVLLLTRKLGQLKTKQREGTFVSFFLLRLTGQR